MGHAWSNPQLTVVVIVTDDQIWIYNQKRWSPVSIDNTDSPVQMAQSIAQLWNLEPAPAHVTQLLVPGELLASFSG